MKDESVMINNFEAANRLLNYDILSKKYPTFREKVNLFFIDYDMIPLIVQDMYLNSMQGQSTMDDIERMAEAADYISMGD